MLNWVQYQFDPTVLLVRRINSEPPQKGKPQKLWVQCIKALVHLQQQSLIQREDGTYVSDLLFDQLTMLAMCLPILLLRVPPRLAAATKASIVIKIAPDS